MRDAVRQELVARQLAAVLGEKPRRIIDVGCGQGTQALRLARAGHEVVGLDPSNDLLARFREALRGDSPDVAARVRLVHGDGENASHVVGERYDAVLCHGVLMYLDDPRPLLRGLDAVGRDGAVVSLLVRNGAALAMRPALLGDWEAAAAAFDASTYLNRLGVQARAHRLDELDAVAGELGWSRDRWYGVRVLTDSRDEDAPAPDLLDRIVEVESEAGARDPYRAVAPLLHVIYRRAGGTALANG